MQPFLKSNIFSVEIDFHIFADPNAPDFRHTEMAHGVAHRISLRIEHRFLRLDDHVNFHVSHANADSFGNKREAMPLRD